MKTQCPHCKVRFNTSDKNAGKQAKCPKCGNSFTIEAFVETPAIVESAAKTPEPVAPSVEKPKQVESPVPTAQTVKSPESAVGPAESKAQVKPPEKIAVDVTPSAKIAKPVEEEKAKPKALSKVLFVYCWIAVRVIAGILGFLGLVLAIKGSTHSILIVVFAAADVFWVGSVLIELILFYKMWAAIQDGQISTSPIKAVSLLFIPVFGFYWALLMLTGFAEDYNSFIRRRSVQAKELSLVLFLIHAFLFIFSEMIVTVLIICVLAFVRLIGKAFEVYPIFSWATFLFVSTACLCYFITHILVAVKTCDAVNTLPD